MAHVHSENAGISRVANGGVQHLLLPVFLGIAVAAVYCLVFLGFDTIKPVLTKGTYAPLLIFPIVLLVCGLYGSTVSYFLKPMEQAIDNYTAKHREA
jgi:hypothetical protein